MTDGELQKLAGEGASLSDTAREALKSELRRRGLEIELQEPAATPPEQASPGPIILRRFRDLPNALVAKSVLESAGIECYLMDANTIRMDWLWSNALGGIKLCVRPEDADAAGKLLDSSNIEAFDVDGVGEYKQPRCPICGSSEITYKGLMRRPAYASIFFFPIPFRHVAWKCRSCGHAWEEEAANHSGRPKE